MTVRSIVILRHAKAERPAGVDDIDRVLSPRGHADAAAIGVWLARHDIRPDLVICSPSQRTRQTWHDIAPALAEAPEVRYESVVYGEDVGALLDLLRHVDNAVTTVAVLGHNPTVSELSDRLDRSADVDLRTSGVAVHRYEGDWAALDAGGAELVETHTARG